MMRVRRDGGCGAGKVRVREAMKMGWLGLRRRLGSTARFQKYPETWRQDMIKSILYAMSWRQGIRILLKAASGEGLT